MTNEPIPVDDVIPLSPVGAKSKSESKKPPAKKPFTSRVASATGFTPTKRQALVAGSAFLSLAAGLYAMKLIGPTSTPVEPSPTSAPVALASVPEATAKAPAPPFAKPPEPPSTFVVPPSKPPETPFVIPIPVDVAPAAVQPRMELTRESPVLVPSIEPVRLPTATSTTANPGEPVRLPPSVIPAAATAPAEPTAPAPFTVPVVKPVPDPMPLVLPDPAALAPIPPVVKPEPKLEKPAVSVEIPSVAPPSPAISLPVPVVAPVPVVKLEAPAIPMPPEPAVVVPPMIVVTPPRTESPLVPPVDFKPSIPPALPVEGKPIEPVVPEFTPTKPPVVSPVVPLDIQPVPKPAVVPPPAAPPGTLQFTKPAGGTDVRPASVTERPVRTDYDVGLHEPRAGETYETISEEWYNSKKLAAALRAYNRNKPLQGQGPVEVPPIDVLRRSFPQFTAGDGRSTAAPPATGASEWTAAGSGSREYVVPAGGRTMREASREVLGTDIRWAELYQINPQVTDPAAVMPAGTRLRVP